MQRSMIQSSRYILGQYAHNERRFYTNEAGLPSANIRCLALLKNEVWAGTKRGIARFSGDSWNVPQEVDSPGNVMIHTMLTDRANRLWIAGGDLLYVLQRGIWKKYDLSAPVISLTEDDAGTLWAVTKEQLYIFQRNEWLSLIKLEKGVEVRHMTSFGSGQVFLATNMGVHYLTGKRVYFSVLGEQPFSQISNDVRYIYVDRSEHLWIATDQGISVYDNKQHWYAINGANGLPIEDVTSIAVGHDGSKWFGTPQGAIRLMNGKWKYYASKRWLPHDEVQAIAILPDGTVWIGTANGLACLSTRYMTLAEKAEHYEQLTRDYHVRDRFVTERRLEEVGNLNSGRVRKTDNDGYWTAVYVAAQSFRYAVTGSEQAKQWAKESLEAMFILTSITKLPGFPARAVRHKTDPEFGDNVVKPLGWVENAEGRWEWKGKELDRENEWNEWRRTADGEWEWLGETSSDEIVGHFYVYSVYYDLVADADEKLRIAATARAIADHLLDNGYQLVDVDGKPTTWARWGPDQLNDDAKWKMQTGINSLEILSVLKSTAHMTGDQKYEEAYRELIQEHHYAMNTLEQKVTYQGRLHHIDDDLGFHAYYPLLMYEQDPDLRAIYMMSLEHHWQYERRERSPMWNFMYGAITGHDCDIEAAIRSLIELPLDLIHWEIRNSQRADLKLDPELEVYGIKQLYEPLPFDERPMHKWDASPFFSDGGNGKLAEDGTVFLHPYWLARYWKLIDEE